VIEETTVILDATRSSHENDGFDEYSAIQDLVDGLNEHGKGEITIKIWHPSYSLKSS